MAKVPDKLVTALFAELEDKGIDYAVLRNYERFPSFSHDVDLVMHTEGIPRWREVAREVADKEGWDVLTECDHWAKSSVRHHNIEVFRFYKFSPYSYLQVDLFHGFPIWGLPLYNERQLLQSKTKSRDARFNHITPLMENLFRMLQIQRLMQKNGSNEKIERYRARVLSYCQDNEQELITALRDEFASSGEGVLCALRSNDMRGFTKKMRLAKVYFFLHYLLIHPVEVVRNIFVRAGDYLRLYMIRQCGFVLKVHSANETERKRLIQGLDLLVEAQILYMWIDRDADKARVTWKEHKIMERGGLVIKWAGEDRSEVILDKYPSTEEVADRIMHILIDRHTVKFRRNMVLQ